MRKGLLVFVGLVVAVLCSGLGISRHSSGDHSAWRVSLAAPASACEIGGDDPDGDGDECTPNPQFDQPKNQGDPCDKGCGDPINFATGNK